jgi:transposase
MNAMHDSKDCIKVSIDECYFSEKVLPHYGYAKKGQRVTTSLLPKSWKKRSLILAVGSDGSLNYEIYYGSINSKLFKEFVTSLNIPENTKLMLDNVRFHHSINTSNCIFTPPYQPKYNPVEYCFSKIKTMFRKLAYEVLDIDDRICKSLEFITKTDIINAFYHVEKNLIQI